MAHLAITIEGGLIASDLVEQIAATPQDVPGQRPADFGLDARLSDEIQKSFSDALIHWNAFNARIARGKESATTITRETWVLPLLEELGFALAFQRSAVAAGGGTFTLSHRLGTDPAAPPVQIVSCEQALDRKGDAQRSPHATVQEFLNRSDALWGIVTNGMSLRLLRNTARFSKPSFIEFDLEAIFKGNLYSEFVPFYRLVHATRLPRGAGDAHECWLEKYYQQGIEQGGRVRARLRDGVQKALETLGTGLLAHPESGRLRDKFASGRLARIEYYRQHLRLIYRLLFLMVAEERRLLFVRGREVADRQEIYDRWYSIERLRKRADIRFFEDTHSDLWEGLKQTFRLFEDTAHAAQLGLTALDGELFGRFACADLIDTRDEAGPMLRNDQLLSAIWHLSTFEDTIGRRKSAVRRRVNFAGLDVEELGSVYESLLDFHPEVKIDHERSKFELVAGSERKETGSYYTPPELVRELIKSALEPVIEARLATSDTRDEKERALLSLKICDPASGSGHFVLAAARRLGRELARVRSGEAEPNPADYRHAVRDVIRRCIYAVDKNPLAVDLCKVALWIEGHEPGLPLSFLDHHVKCGDSLVGVLDLIVLEAGVPDDAYTAVTGDDKKIASEIRKRNKAEAKDLFRIPAKKDIELLADAFAAFADLPETTPHEVRAKEHRYSKLRQSNEWERAKTACDLWTVAFFAPLTGQGRTSVPTTRKVWDAVSGVRPQAQVAELANNLGEEQRFFHWPLEFPDVFVAGGFDIVVGNPPWDQVQLDPREFFSVSAPEIAQTTNMAARERLIAHLTDSRPQLHDAYLHAKRSMERYQGFLHSSGRFPTSSFGRLNLAPLFLETTVKLSSLRGRAGLIMPTGIATDSFNQYLFGSLVDTKRLERLISFENEEFIFPSVHHSFRFCLLVLAPAGQVLVSEFAFFLRNIEQLHESERRFTLSADEIARINPNTRTAPVFRSRGDAALTAKIYSHVPVFIDEKGDPDGNPWQASFQLMFMMNTASGLFRTETQLRELGFVRAGNNWVPPERFSSSPNQPSDRYVPLYEGKMMHQFDHRWATYVGADTRDVTLSEKMDSHFEIAPYYWIPEQEVNDRLATKNWTRRWVIGWRDITSAHVLRTVIATALPRSGVANSFPLLLFPPHFQIAKLAALLGCLNSLTLDYIARHKVGGNHLNFFIFQQLPILPPSVYTAKDLAFIVSRVIELTYTTEDMRSFAQDLGHEGPPFPWDRDRRARQRAELDAYYACLYGLTRRELEYMLDPKVVMGNDYPSETFRVLKENEIRQFGEYRTQRLILEAWDRFVVDGTFDPARLREPQYIDRVSQELTATRAKLEQVEQDSKALLNLARATPKPTLFVEGVTDKKIIEAAWAVFFPNEPMPVKVLAAGGTKEMGSLAGKGKALREVLGEQFVLVLADNDSAGRLLTEDGHVRKGGTWRLLQNGIHWCLLKPTASFSATMKTHNVPADYWPFTIEAAFPPALRRQAQAAGAWRFSGTPQAELLDNPDLARRLFALVPKLGPDDDGYWYLMAPHPEAKETFAAWITGAKQRTEEHYAAFEEIVRGLRAVLARVGNSEATTNIRGAA